MNTDENSNNNVGRPPKFKTPEELETIIQEYFDKCQPEMIGTDKNDKPIFKMNPPTITGLALHLGFESRQSMYDYEKKKEFTYTIKRARLTCEQFAENALLSGGVHPAGPIFILKNYGWKDKTEIEFDGKMQTEGRLSLVDYMNKDDIKNTAENIGTDESSE